MVEEVTPEVGGFTAADLSDLWTVVLDTEEGRDLERELQRELVEGHVLASRDFWAVAARKLRKEVLYWLPRDERWSVVHLTWSDDLGPGWPSTVICDSWREVVEELADRGRP